MLGAFTIQIVAPNLKPRWLLRSHHFGMFDKVFVAFDATPEARRACEIAIDIAAKFQSSITVGTVQPPTKEVPSPDLENLVPIGPEGKTLPMVIEELRAAALGRGVSSLEPVFLHGEVLPALLTYLTEHPQDLAITGSRGLSRGQRLLRGSVSAGLVNEAPCPVLVVRGRHAPRVPRIKPGLAARAPPPNLSEERG
jgi:nucleotide-binding universal stress UspA family protein